MADRPISDLTTATQIKSNDYFVLQQDSIAKKIAGSTLTTYINQASGITSIALVSTSSTGTTYRITYNGGHTFDYTVPFATSAVNKVNGKTGDVTLTGSDINTSSSDTTKIGTKVSELNTSVGTLSNTVSSMSGTVTSLNNTVTSLNSTVGNHTSQISGLTTSVNQFNASLAKTEVLIVTATISSLPSTISNSNIETDMVCLKLDLSNPAAQISDWITNTDTAGKVTISGSISGTTTITLYLMKSR